MKPEASFCFECAYEVVNPIGGVHTVLTTKAGNMIRYYGDNYYMIGPYYPRYAKASFREEGVPIEMRDAFNYLESQNIQCHYGRWLIDSTPKTILVDFRDYMRELRTIKRQLVSEYKIDCKKSGREYNKRIVLSKAISMLMEEILKSPGFKNKRGVFHEHISGSPGIFLMDARRKNLNIGLVATAHSTKLGREIASGNEDLINEIKKRLREGKTVGERREYGYGDQTVTEHHLERVSANSADVVTAVSEITSEECEYILGRKADVITPNGINNGRYPTIEDVLVLHESFKERVKLFLEAYFLPYYGVDTEEALLFFISGRYEFHTKGYDVFIHSLGWLNKILKEEGYPKDIFVFFFVFDRGVRKYNVEVLENLSRYKQIYEFLEERMPDLERRALASLVHENELKQEVFDYEFLRDARKLVLKFKKPEHRRPPLCALQVGKNDVIFNSLKSEGLLNRSNDRVKVIVYPTRVSVSDGLLNMEYYDMLASMDLGIFPSYYEPWGYTPLEAAAYAVPSITTDLAGFGKFISENTNQQRMPGVFIVRRDGRGHEEVVKSLKDLMYWYSHLSKEERVEKRIKAKETAKLADWDNFSEYYIRAHNLAIERATERQGSIGRQER